MWIFMTVYLYFWGDRGDLNPQHSPPQGDALPVELRPPVSIL